MIKIQKNIIARYLAPIIFSYALLPSQLHAKYPPTKNTQEIDKNNLTDFENEQIKILRKSLEHQGDATNYSRYALFISSFSILISSVGIAFIAFQIRLMKKSVDVSVESNELIKSHQIQILRPHLAIEINPQEGELDLWEAKLINVGQSPAALCEIDIEGSALSDTNAPSTPIFRRSRRPFMMTKDITIAFPGPASATHFAASSGASSTKVTCSVTAKYKDIFENEYRTDVLLHIKNMKWSVIAYVYT